MLFQMILQRITLVVTDSNNCTANDSVVVNSNELPIIDVSSIAVDSTNCGSSNGGISGISANGFPVLTYSWSDGNGAVSTDLILQNQPSGTYTLTVTDGNNCMNSSLPIGINDLGGPMIDTSGISLIADTCGQLIGSITGVVASGGVGTLSYTWTFNGDTVGMSADLNGVGAGSYVLTVSDAAGCNSITGPYTLNEIQGATVDESLVVVLNDHCSQGIGAITGIDATGGTGALTYSWSDGTSQVGTADSLINIFVGSYTLTVTDAAGCQTLSSTHNVLNIGGPVLDTTAYIMDSSACNSSIGSISGITASGGVEPYTWNWFDGTSLIDSVQNLSGVAAGSYTVLITDSLGCSDSSGVFNVVDAISVTINSSALTLDSASCGISNGSIDNLLVSGGTAPYTYSWSDGSVVVSSSLNVDSLAVGNYSLTVTDANLCSVQLGPIEIYGASAPQIDLSTAISNPNCNEANGEIAGGIINGGTQPFAYSWTYNGTAFSDSLNINQLDTGSYVLTVTDAGGCSDVESVTLVNGNVGNVNAVDDNYITAQDVAIQTSPSDNDVAGSNPILIGSSLNGTMSNSFFYTPNNGYFGMDSVQYYICDAVCVNVCDTATIFIEVTEERPIKIHTGFSPNGDDINETFHIENIELYPENELVIFSRWGDQVYAAQPYNNEWDGSSEATGIKLSGNKVVDGAYYFILKLTPDSEPINGFIDLRR